MTTSTDITDMEQRMAAAAVADTERPRAIEHFVAASAGGERWPDLEIETQNGHCIARWFDPADPNASAPGLGLALDHGFAFARSGRDDRRQGSIGLVEYGLDPAGGLRARWVHPYLGARIGTGAAERLSGAPGGFAGTYRITYRDADGAQAGPVCLLRVEAHGHTYVLSWAALPDERALFEGIGAVDDRRCLLAAWGGLGEPCDLVVLKSAAEGAELGGWAIGTRSTEAVRERYSLGA
jgi:hypothetical protein